MQKSSVLAGPLRDCERLALEGDRPRELDIRKPASQAMGEGALRSFYRRTAALGDAKADTIDWRWIVLAKWYRLAALGSPYLNVRAVVVAVISIPIESVFTHPKDDLQRAFLAVDVGEANVGLMK